MAVHSIHRRTRAEHKHLELVLLQLSRMSCHNSKSFKERAGCHTQRGLKTLLIPRMTVQWKVRRVASTIGCDRRRDT